MSGQMFTGIIRDKGRIAAVTRQRGDVRMRIISHGLCWKDYAVGESIAVSGVCLTAVAIHEDGFEADVSNETLNVTALGGLGEGAGVNLEPSLSVGDRLGGHLVSGHVDCVGRVVAIAEDARSIRMGIELPDDYARYVAGKGSITIDGVSLTTNTVFGNAFDVNIIPHTADVTTIGDYAVGTCVNIEVDQVARYLERLLEHDGGRLSIEFLRTHGYA